MSVGFVRMLTNPTFVGRTVPVEEALSVVENWFSYVHVKDLNPLEGHFARFGELLESVGVGRNLVNDAHIAALAIENDAELHTNDADFGRFSGLR